MTNALILWILCLLAIGSFDNHGGVCSMLRITHLGCASASFISAKVQNEDWNVMKYFSEEGHQTAITIRNNFYPMLYGGQSDALLRQFAAIQSKYGTLYVDDDLPSLYNLQGVLFFYLNRRQEAYVAFRHAVDIHGNDLRALVNLVDVGRSFHQYIEDSMDLLIKLTGREDRQRKANMANWESLELDIYIDNMNLFKCVNVHRNEDICDYDLINVNLMHFPPPLWRSYLEFAANCSRHDYEKNTYHSPVSLSQLASHDEPSLDSISTQQLQTKKNTMLHVGLILVTNDLNPVNILSYSLIKYLPRERIRLFGFFLNAAEESVEHDWQQDFSKSFDEVINLDGMDYIKSYQMIHDTCQIDILIEMNGMSLNSGVGLLMHRPAPIQMTFLGDPITSGLSYVDYFIGDAQSISVESMIDGFSEKLMLLPTCYLVNSHAISQSHIPSLGRIPRHVFASKHLIYPNQRVLTIAKDASKLINITERSPKNLAFGDTSVEGDTSILHSEQSVISAQQNNHNNSQSDFESELDETMPLIIGAFHGWSKIDPSIFQVWMNILQSSPRDILLLQSNSNGEFGLLATQMRYFGLEPKTRASCIIMTSFKEHLHVKSAIDLYLDTLIKNGHTTTMDAHWAGLPAVAVGGRDAMMSRSSQSAAHYNENDFGIVYSLKEYEDFVITLLKTKEGRRLLQEWRKYTESRRTEGKLFNNKFFATEFGHLLEAVNDMHILKANPNRGPDDSESYVNSESLFRDKKFHVFASGRE